MTLLKQLTRDGFEYDSGNSTDQTFALPLGLELKKLIFLLKVLIIMQAPSTGNRLGWDLWVRQWLIPMVVSSQSNTDHGSGYEDGVKFVIDDPAGGASLSGLGRKFRFASMNVGTGLIEDEIMIYLFTAMTLREKWLTNTWIRSI